MSARSLFIIKPHAVSSGKISEILSIIVDNGYTIIKRKHLVGTIKQWEQHYLEHKDKPFYNSLVTDMADKLIYVYVLEKENCISDLRELVGITDPLSAKEGTLRQQFGETKRNNAVHASDSIESAERETKIWFD